MWGGIFEIKHNDPWVSLQGFQSDAGSLSVGEEHRLQTWQPLLSLQPTQKQHHTRFSLFLFISKYTLLPWWKLTWFWCGWITGFSVINSCCETPCVSVRGQVVRVAEALSALIFFLKCLLWMEFHEGMAEKSNTEFITEKKPYVKTIFYLKQVLCHDTYPRVFSTKWIECLSTKEKFNIFSLMWLCLHSDSALRKLACGFQSLTV